MPHSLRAAHRRSPATSHYDRLAQATAGPVLELSCGIGRIALAQAGLSVTGVDVSVGMLALARRKSERLAATASRCLTFVERDMARLDLGRRFGVAFIAFRSFQHLLRVNSDLYHGYRIIHET